MIDDRYLPTIRRKGRKKGQGDIANNLSEHWVITDFMVDGVLLSLLAFSIPITRKNRLPFRLSSPCMAFCFIYISVLSILFRRLLGVRFLS